MNDQVYKGNSPHHHIIALFWIMFLLLLYSCNDGNLGVVFTPSGSVTIKGNFGATNSNISYSVSDPSADTSSITQALIFTPSGVENMVVAELVDGSFYLNVPTDNTEPVCLMFANANDEKVCHFSLAEGLSSLNLRMVESGSILDLSTIIRDGDVCTSSLVNDSSADIIEMTPDELRVLRLTEAFFESIINNPDVNNDGKIDVLNDQFFYMNTNTFVGTGRFENGSLTSDISGMAISTTNLRLFVKDQDKPSVVTISAPNDETVFYDSYRTLGGDFIEYTSFDDVTGYPSEGYYYIHDYKTGLEFYVSELSTVYDSAINAILHVSLNEDNTLNKIAWDYVPSNDSSTILDPPSFIESANITIEGIGPFCEQYGGGYHDVTSDTITTRIYDSVGIFSSVTEHTLPCSINWDNVALILLTYTDIYGNGIISMHSRD